MAARWLRAIPPSRPKPQPKPQRGPQPKQGPRNKEQGTRNKEQGTRNKEQGTRNDHENDICRLNDCQARRTSCQLYLCEVKFLRKAVGRGVLAELKEKCSRLAKPRHASVLPVLVHVNGVTEGVADSAFLARVIDFSRIVEAPTAAS